MSESASSDSLADNASRMPVQNNMPTNTFMGLSYSTLILVAVVFVVVVLAYLSLRPRRSSRIVEERPAHARQDWSGLSAAPVMGSDPRSKV